MPRTKFTVKTATGPVSTDEFVRARWLAHWGDMRNLSFVTDGLVVSTH